MAHHGQDVGWIKASTSNVEIQLAYRYPETVNSTQVYSQGKQTTTVRQRLLKKSNQH